MTATRRTTLLALAALAGLACGHRTHLTPGHGTSYDAAFAAQRSARAAPAQAATGLDPQEASIIADGYRDRLAPSGRQAKEEPVILVAPQRDGSRAPPPSVPRG